MFVWKWPIQNNMLDKKEEEYSTYVWFKGPNNNSENTEKNKIIITKMIKEGNIFDKDNLIYFPKFSNLGNLLIIIAKTLKNKQMPREHSSITTLSYAVAIL